MVPFVRSVAPLLFVVPAMALPAQQYSRSPFAPGVAVATVRPLALHDLMPGAVSPDGGYFVYQRQEVGSVRLWIVDLATGKQRVLTTGAGARRELVWSHDSRMVAYWGEINKPGHIERRHGIGVVDVETGIERTVYDVTDSGSATTAFTPAWTRDGRIVFGQLQSTDLKSVDPRTGVVQGLRRTVSYNNPKISPDGRVMAYTGSGCAGGRASGIRVLSLVDTSPSRCLLGDVDVIDNLGWSADGRTIYIFGAVRPESTPAVIAVDAAGKGHRRLDLPPLPGKPVRASMLRDGSIAIETNHPFLRVGTVPTTGGVPAVLQRDSGDTSWPLWSNDGTRIAALSGRAQERRDTGVVVQLDARPGPTFGDRITVRPEEQSIARLAVSPDGRCIYTRSGAGRLQPIARVPSSGSYPQSPPVYGRTDAPTRTIEFQESTQWSADGSLLLAQDREKLTIVRRDSTADGACRGRPLEPLVLKGLGEPIIKDFLPTPLNPRLSRDARRIAMSRQDFGRMLAWQTNPEPADTPAVLVVPITGGDVQTLRLLPQDMSYGGPDWSADDGALFFADIAPDGVYRIHRMTLATGAVEIITQGRRGAVHPRVSPDGSMLAVTIVDSYSRVWLLRLRR